MALRLIARQIKAILKRLVIFEVFGLRSGFQSSRNSPVWLTVSV